LITDSLFIAEKSRSVSEVNYSHTAEAIPQDFPRESRDISLHFPLETATLSFITADNGRVA